MQSRLHRRDRSMSGMPHASRCQADTPVCEINSACRLEPSPDYAANHQESRLDGPSWLACGTIVWRKRSDWWHNVETADCLKVCLFNLTGQTEHASSSLGVHQWLSGSMSTLRLVGCGFDGTHCLPAWYPVVRVGLGGEITQLISGRGTAAAHRSLRWWWVKYRGQISHLSWSCWLVGLCH